MANDIDTTIPQSMSCVKIGSRYSRKRLLRQFLARIPPKFLALKFLGPLPKVMHGNQYILVMNDLLSKSAQGIPITISSATK